MDIGIPKEIKKQEGRVSLTPGACQLLVNQSHKVFIQSAAGIASGHSDEEYEASGATVVQLSRELYDSCELVVKVKEPQPSELEMLRPDHILFGYLHLASNPDLTEALCTKGVTAIGFEIVNVNGELPLLMPMSQIAGRLAAQIGTGLLYSHVSGKGLLLGGVEGAYTGRVLVIGAGQAGVAAAKTLLFSGAQITLADINTDRLATVKSEYPEITTIDASHAGIFETLLPRTDLLIGSVLLPGKRAPVVISRNMLRGMPAGGAIVDIAIDQGGCIETSRPTTYDEPTYIEEDIVHFCVTNMPGAVPRTATQALSHAITPYVSSIAGGKLLSDSALQGAIYLQGGKIQYAGLK